MGAKGLGLDLALRLTDSRESAAGACFSSQEFIMSKGNKVRKKEVKKPKQDKKVKK